MTSGIRAALCLLLMAAAPPACPAESEQRDDSVVPPPQWRLAWSDDFDGFDPDRWDRVGSSLLSRRAQRLGRWEIRAKLPGGEGVRTSISLRPDGPWPPAAEIVIVQNRSDRPTITSSAFHWVAANRDSRQTFAVEQQTAIGDELVSYADGFHTFACEWVGHQLRFYVDDMHHGTFYNDEVGYMLPRLSVPMRLAIDAAVAVDWVRVYELAGEPGIRTFRNGGFDEGGGSPAGWHIFGNRIDGTPNVLVHREAARDGTHALKISGESTGESNYTGVAQGISVAGGERVRARLSALVRSEDDLTDPNDRAWMKIEFYKHWGSWFSGPAMLGVEERVIADAATPTGAWQDYELEAVAPAGAVEARLTLVFGQAASEPGAVHIDSVDFSRVP